VYAIGLCLLGKEHDQHVVLRELRRLFVSLQTSDLDETRCALARHFYSNFVDVLQPSVRLATSMQVVRFGPVTLGDIDFGTDLRLRMGELGAYHVDVLLSGRLLWQQGRGEPLVATDTSAAVFQPVGDTVLERWTGDCRLLAVKIDRGALEAQLARMLDAPAGSEIRLGPRLDTYQGAGRSWARLIRLLAADATNENGLAHHPLLAESIQETLLSGLLLATDHPYRDRLDRLAEPYPAPRAVRRAMDAMQTHPERPFTIAKLADIAGVGQRSLQQGFQRSVGMSPLAYLRQVRLARVHEQLSHADPAQATVAAVASRWGFVHFGRFAGAYRMRYDASPSQTLRAAAAVPGVSAD
jgi:AraC-like DNA-binding protein